jgi:hypothetical protein
MIQHAMAGIAPSSAVGGSFHLQACPAVAGARLRGLGRRRTRPRRPDHRRLRPALLPFVSCRSLFPGQERAPEQSWWRGMARPVSALGQETDGHYLSPFAAPRTGRGSPPDTPADARHRCDARYRHIRRGPERKMSHIFGQLTPYEPSPGPCDSASLPFEFRTNTYVSRQARLITSKSSYSAHAPFSLAARHGGQWPPATNARD